MVKNFKEIDEIAKQIVLFMKKNNINVLGLIGDLGTGKTHFTKMVAKELEINENIKSPTFNYVNTYNDTLAHFDVYRLNDSSELSEIGFDDYLEYPFVIIEWANIISDYLPKDTLFIEFKYIDEDKRDIKIYFQELENVNIFNNNSN